MIWKHHKIYPKGIQLNSLEEGKTVDAGADVYLTKPIGNKKLMDTLEKLLAQKET